MKIIFVSATCDRRDYEEICKNRKVQMLDSSQKFFEMFLGGLNQMDGVSVDCLTVRPISHSTYPGYSIPAKETKNGNLTYHYVKLFNVPVLKSIFAARRVRKKMRALLRQYKDEDVRIICDPLLMEGLTPTVRLGKKYGVMTAGFLTDMPDFADECDEHGRLKRMMYRVYHKRVKRDLSRLDRYIVLTEAMREVAADKPWLLLDCIVDETMLCGLEAKAYEDGLPHILYAGKLHREFGLKLLGDAMQRVQHPCVFDLYGDGNYVEELKEIAKKQSNIRIHGIVPLKEVLGYELSSTVLINPRTSEGEFTKYSFPSKTAEYMLTGIPVVMFRLPGISAEYGQYICFADEESADGFAKKIDEVLSKTEEERENLGAAAKAFVLENKNNVAQAGRVIEFLR